MRRGEEMLPEGAPRASKEKIVAEEVTPSRVVCCSDYGAHSIQPYLDSFELMRDPQLLDFELDGRKLGKHHCRRLKHYAPPRATTAKRRRSGR
jgi:hypothetical protein